jgi:hypothetical protein
MSATASHRPERAAHDARLRRPPGRRPFLDPFAAFLPADHDLLALMNLDEDHLRDFKNVMHDCTVPWVLSNPTVGPREFAALKKDGMGPGAQAVAAWLAQLKNPFPGPQPDFGDVQIRWYYPFFVPGAENKTNDLSLAVIAQFGAFKILFAGDLEVAGWRRLLTIPSFRQTCRTSRCSSPPITAEKAVAAPICSNCSARSWSSFPMTGANTTVRILTTGTGPAAPVRYLSRTNAAMWPRPARMVPCASTSQRTGAGPSSELQFATGRGRLLLPSSSSGLARSQP